MFSGQLAGLAERFLVNRGRGSGLESRRRQFTLWRLDSTSVNQRDIMIGERIKRAPVAAGLSQREVAERAELSAMAVSKFERELSNPTSQTLIRLARALGTCTEFFLRPTTIELLSLFPTSPVASETPKLFERLVLYAQAEEMIPTRSPSAPAGRDRRRPQARRGRDVLALPAADGRHLRGSTSARSTSTCATSMSQAS